MAEVASILNSVKQTLGLAEDYNVFDHDVLMHINSTFSTLNQLGIGPRDGFQVIDATVDWDEFLDDPTLAFVKSYVYLRVRLLFDYDTLSGPVLMQMEKQIKELEWRIQVQGEALYE